jgi:hypothetical protein
VPKIAVVLLLPSASVEVACVVHLCLSMLDFEISIVAAGVNERKKQKLIRKFGDSENSK